MLIDCFKFNVTFFAFLTVSSNLAARLRRCIGKVSWSQLHQTNCRVFHFLIRTGSYNCWVFHFHGNFLLLSIQLCKYHDHSCNKPIVGCSISWSGLAVTIVGCSISTAISYCCQFNCISIMITVATNQLLGVPFPRQFLIAVISIGRCLRHHCSNCCLVSRQKTTPSFSAIAPNQLIPSTFPIYFHGNHNNILQTSQLLPAENLLWHSVYLLLLPSPSFI